MNLFDKSDVGAFYENKSNYCEECGGTGAIECDCGEAILDEDNIDYDCYKKDSSYCPYMQKSCDSNGVIPCPVCNGTGKIN